MMNGIVFQKLELYLHDHGEDDIPPVCRIDFNHTGGEAGSGHDIGFSPDQLVLITQLLTAHSHAVHDLMNRVAESAYELGLKHGESDSSILYTSSLWAETNVPPGRFCELVNKYRASIQEDTLLAGSDEPAEPCDFGGRLTGFGFTPKEKSKGGKNEAK